MSAINAEKLSKRYDNTVALDRLDLTVNEGEVYGYLGPNGACAFSGLWDTWG
jgi:ABC-2 type transport system ATP-binding protein